MLLLPQENEGGRDQLRDLNAKVSRLVGTIGTAGGVPELNAKLAEVKAQRDRLAARPQLPATDEIRALVDERLSDLRGVLEATPDEGHRVLRGLAGGERWRVYADDKKGFRVEGILRLNVKTARATKDTGRFTRMVAGARSDRLHTAGHPLVVRIQFSS